MAGKVLGFNCLQLEEEGLEKPSVIFWVYNSKEMVMFELHVLLKHPCISYSLESFRRWSSSSSSCNF